MGPFEVSKELVARLDDEQLRKLLERLLVAEASARGIAHIAISVGGNQTAVDGGVDASMDWSADPEPSGWLPRRLIYFQCKAEAMGPAKLRTEMRPNGKPRPIFAELAAAGGAYVVFSTDDPSKSAMDGRLTTLREAVGDVDGAERIHLDFYGADRIARWANLHPGVAIWLIGQDGRALGGWRPYGDWSAEGAASQPYIVDDKARATLLPAEALSFHFEISFPTAAIGTQRFDFVFSARAYAAEIAPARTFGFVKELDYLKSIDRGHGASLANTLAIDGDAVLNRDIMRFPDEFVRHKILDAIGDMALAGAPLIARFEGTRSGHGLNNALLRALFADPANYRWQEL